MQRGKREAVVDFRVGAIDLTLVFFTASYVFYIIVFKNLF